ncbi:hypothetical protein [Streptomyces fumanus]|uniref:Uncharacterized protein n=1 Tax=Streptomyces fumanus TaxID=67302 RepID=A0A919DZ37_9ACTN|nr:hypothetical protein [Streptomyces fumanus]GHF00274.1 hypothetical protein GCM10018772_26050 [Streptomyces fumanus]
MPSRPRSVPILTGAALVCLALVPPAWGRPGPAPDPAAEAASTLCAPAGTLRGAGGQRAAVLLCAGGGPRGLSVSAPATCRVPGTAARYACLTSGTWTARRAGRTVASGALPGADAVYPGPGTYTITAEVRARSAPEGVDLRGTVRASLTLRTPRPAPTHRVEVDRTALRPGTGTTLTYTVHQDSAAGDGSARLGLIGEERTGVRLATDDARCVSPVTGGGPAGTRLRHALDCALTGLRPGRPATVRVRVTLGPACSTVVSRLGYWLPRGQEVTGGMLPGPTVRCG